MRLEFATAPGDPGTPNEDAVFASPDLAIVLDGVTPLDRTDIGCVHGVAWYAHTLGAELVRLASDRGAALPDCLATAIERVAHAHIDQCDLDHPDGPAATVSVVRTHADTADYLALADSPIVFDRGAEPYVVTDSRPGDLSRRLRAQGIRPPAREFRTTYRNQPDGYWVAAQDPAAAKHALTGSVDLADVRRILLASDGASRLVDLFHVLDWTEALDAIETDGTAGWIERTRAYEREFAASSGRPLAKPHDDASVVLWRTLC